MNSRLQFDMNATTSVAPGVQQRLSNLYGQAYANPSSSHLEGQRARQILDEARHGLEMKLDCSQGHLLFNSGSTEGNNYAIGQLWRLRGSQRRKILCLNVEHDSVSEPIEALKDLGAQVIQIPVSRDGRVHWEKVDDHLDDQVAFVSMMLVQNETGFIFDVAQMKNKLDSFGVLLHVDIACALGKIPFSFNELGADVVAFSAHKFHGPKGIGGVIVSKSLDFKGYPLGGVQQRGLRAGTEPLELIAAMDEALSYVLDGLEDERERLSGLRNKLKKGIQAIEKKCFFNESAEHQTPGCLSVGFPGVDGQMLLTRLDLEGVSASHGSACQSGSMEVSPVLLAMGLEEAEARCTIRLSFGRGTQKEDVDRLLEILGGIIPELKK